MCIRDSISTTYGTEIDALLVKKLSDSATMVIKGAYFMGDAYPDIEQISAQIDFKL